ncbi:7151_t:CDS:10 [Ambispora gerdemannii]|uniref:7151_t:CDS:1 n=1 Tax=Ambispora gerdemannii TaxID=144530 RepID=A0A9N9D2I6_9GLOM|nr:7151_t:CDS:10 [Ambispora gerdemannii]
MTHSKTRREKQRSYLLNHADPRPLNFFSRFKYRSSSNAYHDYGLRLNRALQEAPDSKKLLNLRRKWDNDEYRDDWACYKDSLEDRKANRKVKKRKREAHISFHEQLDGGLDGKSRQTGDTTSDNDRELVNNDDTSFVTQTESTSSDNDDDNSNISLVAQTQTETTTTDNYDDSKKFVSSLAPQIEIVLGDFISNEERSNDELDAYVNETIRDGNKWIVCDTDVRDLLVKWKQEKPRPRTDLAFYDIIDITPGSNSDFVQSLPNDAVQDMKQSKRFPTPNVDEMKNYIIDFIKTNEFRNFVDESYLKTRVNNKTKFVWDYLNILVESFERDNDLTNYNLSEFGYREIFFTPLIRSLFRGTHREMNIYFGNRKKKDGEDRNVGRKIDIIWSMKLTDLEFSIGEISGPPNQLDHSHFFNDKIKIAKMLKVSINRIVKKYGGTGMDLSLVKLYGLHVYYNEVIVYEMSIPFRGLYIFCEVMRSKLPTNEVEIGLILQSVSVFLKFKELLGKSLADLRKYIQDACTRTPDNNENAHLFITLTDLTPEKKKVQPVNGKKRK